MVVPGQILFWWQVCVCASVGAHRLTGVPSVILFHFRGTGFPLNLELSWWSANPSHLVSPPC